VSGRRAEKSFCPSVQLADGAAEVAQRQRGDLAAPQVGVGDDTRPAVQRLRGGVLGQHADDAYRRFALHAREHDARVVGEKAAVAVAVVVQRQHARATLGQRNRVGERTAQRLGQPCLFRAAGGKEDRHSCLAR